MKQVNWECDMRLLNLYFVWYEFSCRVFPWKQINLRENCLPTLLDYSKSLSIEYVTFQYFWRNCDKKQSCQISSRHLFHTIKLFNSCYAQWNTFSVALVHNFKHIYPSYVFSKKLSTFYYETKQCVPKKYWEKT